LMFRNKIYNFDFKIIKYYILIKIINFVSKHQKNKKIIKKSLKSTKI